MDTTILDGFVARWNRRYARPRNAAKVCKKCGNLMSAHTPVIEDNKFLYIKHPA